MFTLEHQILVPLENLMHCETTEKYCYLNDKEQKLFHQKGVRMDLFVQRNLEEQKETFYPDFTLFNVINNTKGKLKMIQSSQNEVGFFFWKYYIQFSAL